MAAYAKMDLVGDMKNPRPKVAKTTGYSFEIFPVKTEDKFICHLCKLVLRHPVQTRCGHRFCNGCFNEIVQGGSKDMVCPRCREEDCVDESSTLKQGESFPDMAIHREMKLLNTKCINDGCVWTGPFNEYQKHSDNCTFTLVRCTKCYQLIKVLSQQNHEITDCPLRLVACQYCDTKITCKDLELHVTVCPKRPCQCDRCGATLYHDDLPTHQHPDSGTCLFVKCPLGCSGLVERQHVEEHNKALCHVHNDFLLKRIATTKEKHTAEVSVICSRLDDVEVRVTALQEQPSLTKDQTGGHHASSTAEKINALEERVVKLEQSRKVSSALVGVLHREASKNADSLTHQQRNDEEFKESMESKIRDLERSVILRDLMIKELNDKLELSISTTFDGILLWKVAEFSKKMEAAQNGTSPRLWSPPFWTSRIGYKMRACLYLRGDGAGKGTHISAYFQLVQGDYDAVLSWPFSVKNVQFWILDQNERQKEHHIDAFRPDPTHAACRRPNPANPNPAIGCPELMPLGRLEGRCRKYVVDDTMFIKVIVST